MSCGSSFFLATNETGDEYGLVVAVIKPHLFDYETMKLSYDPSSILYADYTVM